MQTRRVILPREFSDMSDFMDSSEFKDYIKRKKREEESSTDGELVLDPFPAAKGISSKGPISAMLGRHVDDSFVEGFINEFKREKEEMSEKAGGEEVYVITGSMIDAMALGNPICINGVWIAISEKSDMRLVEEIENKWVKEWGLIDGEEE